MTAAIAFSGQNNAASLTAHYLFLKNIVLAVILVLESKGLDSCRGDYKAKTFFMLQMRFGLALTDSCFTQSS